MTEEKTYCQNCGKEVGGHQKFCDDCGVLKDDLFYAYSTLRFDVWQHLEHHGKGKTHELYSKMVNEEGEKWTHEALGNKLVDAILGIGY